MPAIFISAGEASGEHYGAQLIAAVRGRLPEAQFFGLGGRAMEAAGCERIVRAEDVAVMGITEILRHAPRIYREYRRLRASIRSRRPALAVLIDFPDVNFRLARECKSLGIPVLWLVSPQLWAWKQHRIRWVQERVAKMLVIFPFEQDYYRARGVDAEFIGHPLADLPLPAIAREEFAARYGLDPAKQWIGLLPGSRARELGLNLPAMAAAAQLLGPGYEYLLPAAPTLDRAWVRAAVPSGANIYITEDARATLHHARASMVASGTATIEAALIGNPFVVVYRLSGLSYAVARRVVQVPHVAMANLIAQKRVVPELIQQEFTPENIVRHLRPLLEDTPARAQMMEELGKIGNALRVAANESAIDRAAVWVIQLLNREKNMGLQEPALSLPKLSRS